jgi:ABC-type multidrug transport system fused ATPase/permease subunit
VVFRDWANVSFQDQQDHFWSFFGLVIGLSAAAAILTQLQSYGDRALNENKKKANFIRLLRKVMNAPINLYFDVTPANEISQMVDADFSKYDGFKDSIQGILYPAYALV